LVTFNTVNLKAVQPKKPKTQLQMKTILPGKLLVAALAPVVFSAISSQADVITAFSGVSTILNVNGPGGESITLSTQLSYGNFTGFGNEYLYQYRVLVNAASPAIDGFNLWTPSLAVFNANAGNNAAIANQSINFATTGAGANGGAANFANLFVASQQDPGGAGPGGSTIPATPGGAAPFNNVAAFLPNGGFSTAGNPNSYTFPGLAAYGFLNGGFNFDTAAAVGIPPIGQNVGGKNWGFTYWANKPGGAFDGNQLIRWFAINPGADSLNPGQSMVFDAFSPFPPVAGGAFPDPIGPEVIFSLDDVNGDTTLPTLDPVSDVPEPSTWSLLALAGVVVTWQLRRRTAQA
jgi:hypothetical protein